MARVSVVIPAYNAAPFIRQTVESALASTFRDIEIVVVDDGSSDGSGDRVEGLDPRVRVLRQPNAGMSAARNKGIAASDSEYIALLDSDDIWHPMKVAAQVEVLDRRPDVSFCFGEFRVWDGTTPADFPDSVDSQALVPELTGWIYHMMILTNWALPSSLMFRRKVIEGVGAFPTIDSKTDDWEYAIRASRLYQFAKLRDVVVLYRQHPSQLSRRLPLESPGRRVREAAIAQYGLRGPDGREVSHGQLAQRRYATEIAFAAEHLVRGRLTTGLGCLGRAVLLDPFALRPYRVLAASLVKRLLRLGPG